MNGQAMCVVRQYHLHSHVSGAHVPGAGNELILASGALPAVWEDAVDAYAFGDIQHRAVSHLTCLAFNKEKS